MSIQRVWLFIAVATVVVLVGVLVALPAWASAPGQTDEPSPDAYTAMHEACEAGDVQGMSDAMDSLDEEDWAAMEEHMGDGQHGAMGTGMMGSGGMMGGQSGRGMMGW